MGARGLGEVARVGTVGGGVEVGSCRVAAPPGPLCPGAPNTRVGSASRVSNPRLVPRLVPRIRAPDPRVGPADQSASRPSTAPAAPIDRPAPVSGESGCVSVDRCPWEEVAQTGDVGAVEARWPAGPPARRGRRAAVPADPEPGVGLLPPVHRSCRTDRSSGTGFWRIGVCERRSVHLEVGDRVATTSRTRPHSGTAIPIRPPAPTPPRPHPAPRTPSQPAHPTPPRRPGREQAV